MKAFWLGLAAAGALVGATAAQATIFTFDIQQWNGVGSPPADDTNPADFAHLVVDDAFGGTIGNAAGPDGLWTYGNDGSYFGSGYQNAVIDIYTDDAGGGFTFIPYVVDANGNDPDRSWELDLYGPSALGSTAGVYHILPGVYDTDDGDGDYFRVTIAQGDAAPVTAVPEPASWAMIVGGFALAGTVLRKHKRATASFA